MFAVNGSDVRPGHRHADLLLQRGGSRAGTAARRRSGGSWLDELLAAITVLPLDGKAARRAAEIDGTLRRAGTLIGPMDTLIAGTTLAHGATLVTHNLSEFRRVRGLSLVDWY